MELAEVIGLVVLICLALAIVVIAVRRALLARAGGFDVSWRVTPNGSDRGWTLGQGRYRGSQLGLYRSFSPLPVAAKTLDRGRLTVGVVRDPVGAEPDLLPVGALIVRCSDGGSPLELALSVEALTGLKSWVESRPPGVRPTPARGIGDGPSGSPGSPERGRP
jgi:hypothetical protein